MLNYFRQSSLRRTQENVNGLIDLSDLKPFDVHLARLEGSPAISMFDLTEVITEWMNDSYEYQLKSLGYTTRGVYSDFDTVILLERHDQHRRLVHQSTAMEEQLEQLDQAMEHSDRWLESSNSNGQLYTARFKGAALFTRNSTELSVPSEVIHFIQEQTLTNKTGLLNLLQLSESRGLGSSVVDLNAFTVTPRPSSASTDSSGGAASLQAIIVIAVVVAAIAFVFLLAAIWWAWRYDRKNRQAYLNNKSPGSATRTSTDPASSLQDTPAAEPSVPVAEIGGEASIMLGSGNHHGGVYPESVISEDISTSLSQYYRSGMPGCNHSSSAFNRNNNHLSDAASVSSMESYGYSLDGYSMAAGTEAGGTTAGGGRRSSKPAAEGDTEAPPAEF